MLNSVKSLGLAPITGKFLVYPLVAVLGFVIISGQNSRRQAGIYDEGIIAYGSSLVSRGHVPYRDFWTVYAPGQFYAVATAFKIGGESLDTLRVWDSSVRAAILLVIFIIVSGMAGTPWAVSTWLVGILWMCRWGSYGYPSMPAILFSLLAAEILRRYLAKPSSLRAFMAGIFCGLTFLFRQDFGVYLTIPLIAAFFGYYLLSKRDVTALKSVIVAIAGVVTVVSVPVIYFAVHVPFQTLLYDLLIYPGFISPPYRFLPYPVDVFTVSGNLELIRVLNILPFYFPFVIVALALYTLVKNWSYRSVSHSKSSAYLFGVFLLVLVLLFFNQTRIRSDMAHLQPFFLSALVLQGFVISETRTWRRAAQIVCICSLVVLNILTGLTSARIFYHVHYSSLSDRGIPLKRDFLHALEYVESNTKLGEYIFSGNIRHDKVVYNNVLIYFLAKRDCPSTYSVFDPGVVTNAEVQQRIVHDIESRNVNVIILYDSDHSFVEPNRSSESSGVFLLDEYIRKNFSMAADFGDYSAWRRNKQ